ncbi:alginate O-acetyltransferase AlgX-related protein [Pseudomonas urmiensis]|jgi:alginate O-acetyltransferase complex protein AlgJ|uniref:Twin-arginine translocation pathway signal n=1 Tax=Pseudomonas urmiensis TaxID=2745493 RepID=A0A923JVI3_9PSED|nr:twin-arginine translocation pathway signal [Pseudomonas urmiensis]MBV4538930.1 twin-arginine translocation pathway signal [Pseudomonas urmiensis]
MLSLPLFTLSCKRLASALLAVSLGCAAINAQADDSSIVIQGKDGWLFPGWGSLTEVDSRGIEASTALIKDAQQALAARGVHLQVLVLPDKTRFYQDKLPAGKTLSAQVQQRYQSILASLHKAGISALDDAAVLEQVRQGGKDVFYRTDQHWTQVAADATAQATAEQIKRDVPALKGSAGSGMTLGSEFKERRFGDLAERFLTPEQRKQTGRETFTVRRQAAATGLLDSAPAPVHVTGHSMVQPYFGFPQKLSNSVDRPVSVNWKPGNVGQWIMLLEYLESADFKNNPPQVLVWQMFEPTYAQGPQASGLWDNASIMSADAWRQRLRSALGR